MQTSGNAHVQETFNISPFSNILISPGFLSLSRPKFWGHSWAQTSPAGPLMSPRHRTGRREGRASSVPHRFLRRPGHKGSLCSSYLQRFSPHTPLLHHFISQDFAPLVCGSGWQVFPRSWPLASSLGGSGRTGRHEVILPFSLKTE